jgi:hypothetical protein
LGPIVIPPPVPYSPAPVEVLTTRVRIATLKRARVGCPGGPSHSIAPHCTTYCESDALHFARSRALAQAQVRRSGADDSDVFQALASMHERPSLLTHAAGAFARMRESGYLHGVC